MTSLSWFTLSGDGNVLSFNGNLNIIGDVNITGDYYKAGTSLGGGGGGGGSFWSGVFGSGIYYTGGPVGIGLTNPNSIYKLDVDGDVNITGQFYRNGVLFTGDGGGSTLWAEPGGKLSTTVNVGINTSNPQTSLHIGDSSTSLDVSKGIRLGIGSTFSILNFVTPVTGTPYFLMQARQSAGIVTTGNVSINPEGGFVGIGTTSPGFTLDVAGNLNFSGEIYKNGILVPTGGGQNGWINDGPDVYFLGGNVGVGGIASATFRMQVNGNVNLSSTLNSFNIGTTQVLSRTGLGTSVVTSSLTTLGNLSGLSVRTNTLFVNPTNDRVGIGRTDPVYKLDVVGVINATQGVFSNGFPIVEGNTLGSTIVNSSLTTLGTLTSLSVGGNTTMGGNLSVAGTSGFFGALTVSDTVSADEYNIGINPIDPRVVYTVTMTSGYNNTSFFPMVFSDTDSPIYFEITMPAQASSAPYNSHSVIGVARGGGSTDQLNFYDILHRFSDASERSIGGLYRGTSDFKGLVLYLRGGTVYTVKSTRPVFVPFDEITEEDSTFAIKNESMVDIIGTSANISIMWNGITAEEGRHQTQSIEVGGSGRFGTHGRIVLRDFAGDGPTGRNSEIAMWEEDSNENYGFRLRFQGQNATEPNGQGQNTFAIIRHDNNAAGTPALVVQRVGGNIGIGITNPSTRLHVLGASRSETDGQNQELVGTTHVYTAFFPRGVSTGRKGYLGFGSSNTTNLTLMNQDTGTLQLGTNDVIHTQLFSTGAMTVGYRAGVVGGLYLTPENISLYGNPSVQAITGSFAAENLLLNPAGANVGVGTTATPVDRLVVRGAIRATGQSNNFSVGGTSALMDFVISTKVVRIGSVAGGDSNTGIQGEVSFIVNNVEGMRLTASGNVGIGTSNPGTNKLQVQGDINFTGDIYKNGVLFSSGNGSQWITSGTDIYYNTGNVGVGTTDPKQTFHIFDAARTGTDTGVRFLFGDTSGAEFHGISLENGTNAGYAPSIRGRSFDSNDEGLFIIGQITSAADTVTGKCIYLSGRQGTSLGAPVANATILTVSNFGTELMTVRANGRVGIGTTNPAATLDVQGTAGSINYILGQYYVVDTVTAAAPDGNEWVGAGTGNYGISILAKEFMSAAGYIVYSDSRIKTNVSEIDDGESLLQLRKIEPVKYEYVDKVQRYAGPVYGFIAQQVREEFPEAVTVGRNFVPDIYSLCPVFLESQRVHLGDKARTGNLKLIRITGPVDVKVEFESEGIVKILSGDDIKPLSESDIQDGKIFVYGYEVDDFHSLNKDYLFTINFAATQEIDRRQQAQTVQLETLTLENGDLKSRLQNLVSENNYLQGKTDDLATENISLKNRVEELESQLSSLITQLVNKGVI